ncbi:hypothetical protein HC823_00335 [Candidatus Gracilibacteria bacterium]|nr:hypothetical protein [Candidatus Gracilibacteria bacterium]
MMSKLHGSTNTHFCGNLKLGKKIFSIASALFLFSIAGIASAQTFDIGEFMVKNASMENQNAEITGARPGDVLKYELKIAGAQDLLPELDVSGVERWAEFINTGGGDLSAGMLAYPAFSGDRDFSFFVRVNRDARAGEYILAYFGDQELRVRIAGLSDSGPNGLLVGIFILVILMGYVFLTHRRENA